MEALDAAKAAHFDAASGACDYAALHASAERARVAACLAELEAFDLQRVAIPAQTAFWLNVFNAVVLRDSAELAAAGSVHAVGAFFEGPRLKVGPFEYSLDDIEHGLLRGNLPKFGARRAPMQRDDPRLAYMPLAYDERMHFAMYSVARSSPAPSSRTRPRATCDGTCGSRMKARWCCCHTSSSGTRPTSAASATASASRSRVWTTRWSTSSTSAAGA